MFRKQTTIVVGAGASCELDLPSGDALKQKITDLLRTSDENMYGFSNEQVLNALKYQARSDANSYVANWNEAKEVATRIRRGLPLALSIDNYLHAHQGDRKVEVLGKMAIALSILQAERRSKLFPTISPVMIVPQEQRPTLIEPKIDLNRLADTWYIPFAQLLMSQARRDNPAKAFENVRFVIFNYDRCLEHFLWLALQSYFDLSGIEAAEILAGVEFIHPYGSLGPLPWQHHDFDGTVALGDWSRHDLFDVGQRLKTFTESVESDVGAKVKHAVAQAHTLLILGFGYLDQNLQLLKPEGDGHARRLITTAFGVSDLDQSVMKDALKPFAHHTAVSITIDPASCFAMFANHRLELSLR